MLRQRREADPCADAAGLVEQAVVELEAGGEAAVIGVGVGIWRWGCRGGGGRGGVGSRRRRGHGSGRRETGIGPEIVKTPDAEESAVGAVEVLGAVLADVMLEEGEDGAAALEARVADAGELELLGGREAPEVQGFERGLREVEAAVQEGIWVAEVSSGVPLVSRTLVGWVEGNLSARSSIAADCGMASGVDAALAVADSLRSHGVVQCRCSATSR